VPYLSRFEQWREVFRGNQQESSSGITARMHWVREKLWEVSMGRIPAWGEIPAETMGFASRPKTPFPRGVSPKLRGVAKAVRITCRAGQPTEGVGVRGFVGRPTKSTGKNIPGSYNPHGATRKDFEIPVQKFPVGRRRAFNGKALWSRDKDPGPTGPSGTG